MKKILSIFLAASCALGLSACTNNNEVNVTATPENTVTASPTATPVPEPILSMEPFADGERVCFLGDSITAANKYFCYIFDRYNTVFPERHVEFYNCGASGGRTTFANKFFESEVVKYNPTTVVIMLGINDSSCNWYNPPAATEHETIEKYFTKYKINMMSLVEKILGKNIKVVLCTPMLYAEQQASGTDENLIGAADVMLRYGDWIKQYAAKKGIPVCDYGTFFKDKIPNDKLYESDRVHPNDKGHFLMAQCFLQFQGIEPVEKLYDIPKYQRQWREKVNEILRINDAECRVLAGNFTGDAQKDIAYVQEMIDKKEFTSDDLEELANLYVKAKPEQDKLREEIISMMQKGVKP